MDKSKINQTELSYSCGAGAASVNLYTGRLLYEHFDGSIGRDSYQIDLSHLYNSYMSLPSYISTNMGKRWKLNVQQYLYQEDSKYIYIDASGRSHSFEAYAFNKYYDTSGLGLLLSTENGQTIITDNYDNKMYFNNHRLQKTVSSYNKKIIQQLIYDEEGKLKEIFDSRQTKYKFVLDYNSNDLLESISVRDNNIEKSRLNFDYNESNLSKITYSVNSAIIKTVLFYYEINKLSQAVILSDRSTLKFKYSGNKVIEVIKGIASVNEVQTFEKNNIYVGNDVICDDNNYSGEKEYAIDYRIDHTTPTSDNIISKNMIEYRIHETANKVYTTIVENEVGLKMLYYFNENGYITSILEAHNGNILDLRTLEKDPGQSMIEVGTDIESINTRNAYCLLTNQTLSTDIDNEMGKSLANINEYLKNKCKNYKNFAITFWLKVTKTLSNDRIKLTIKEKKKDTQGVSSIVTIDNSALHSWQLVTIPINIPYKEIEYIELSFLSKNSDELVKIADMRICYNVSSKLCLTDNVNIWDAVENVKKVKYISSTYPYSQESLDINQDLYLTEKDLQNMYFSRFKKMGNDSTNQDYLISFNDGTKQKLVRGVTLCTDKKEFEMNFGSDEYGSGTRTNFFFELVSPDENLYSYNIVHFIKQKEIYGKKYDCICQITETNKYLKTDEKNITTTTEIYSDFFGNILMTQDEYGVQTIYTYDEYGIANKKIIRHNEIDEEIISERITNSQFTKFKNQVSEVTNFHNNIDGEVESIQYKGKDEDDETALIKNNNYDRYTHRIKSLENNLNGRNYAIYSNSGRILQISPKEFNDNNLYAYKYDYNNFGDICEFSRLYRNTNHEIVKDLIVEKSIERLNGITSSTYHRDENAIDTKKIYLDKYGRTIQTEENGEITTFERQRLWESAGASAVTEMHDPFEKQDHYFDYDSFNNLKNYSINKDGKKTFEMYAESDTKRAYRYTDSRYQRGYSTDIEYDENVLMSPRVKHTLNIESTDASKYYIHEETDYDYDKLGRLKCKTHKIHNIYSDKTFKELSVKSSYKKGTNLKEKIEYMVEDNKAPNIDYVFDCQYNNRGLIEKQISKIENTKTLDKLYKYDQANRLVQENDNMNHTTIQYNYTDDGLLESIFEKNNRDNAINAKKFKYINGRLKSIHEENNSEMTNEYLFEYDKLGNCTQGLGAKYIWTRGSLLKNYTGNGKNFNYDYNNCGIRYKKEDANGKTITYVYDDKKLLAEIHSPDIVLEYIYDAEDIIGFNYYGGNILRREYVYIKDQTSNVISIINDGEEVGRYEYDSWGNCKVVLDRIGIATTNPIRWKSQYYDNESNLYYINNRYYSPVTRQFITPADIETTLTTYGNIYKLNLYSLNIDNPINVMYYSYNISENNTLQYDPPELSFWQSFSQNKVGKIIAGIVFVASLAASIAVWICQGNSTIFQYLIGGIASSLLVGGIYAGWQVRKRGESFFSGFANYINHNWSLVVAIESIQTIIQCGVSTIAYAIKTRAINKRNAKIENAKITAKREVEKHGTELLTKGEKGKPRAVSVAVDIETGDIYQGKSKERPKDINQALLEQMPDESLTKWTVNNCAEISAVNKALQNGAKMENLVVATLCLDWKTVTFTSFSACSNCRISLSGVLFIVTESNHTI